MKAENAGAIEIASRGIAAGRPSAGTPTVSGGSANHGRVRLQLTNKIGHADPKRQRAQGGHPSRGPGRPLRAAPTRRPAGRPYGRWASRR